MDYGQLFRKVNAMRIDWPVMRQALKPPMCALMASIVFVLIGGVVVYVAEKFGMWVLIAFFVSIGAGMFGFMIWNDYKTLLKRGEAKQ
jgi:hypothetical protein